jgi:N-acetyl-alpha-D-glucosaminyl L-malate synthase BshA
MRMIKIGIVCYPTFGGSGVMATELGKALAEKGHMVHFITYQQPVRLSGFYTNIFYHEVRIPHYPLFDFPPYETTLASTMVDVVLNHQLDLLHVHYAIPHASAAYMAKQILKKKGIHIPVITTLHGTDITLVGKDKTFEPVVTFSINESDAITAVSNNLQKETYQSFDIEKEIHVIYNFVDIKRFSKKPLDAFKKAIAPNGEKIITHASNFRRVKRVRDVIDIFHLINKKVPAKLLMVGDGPDRPEAEEHCRKMQLYNDIKFLGKQHEMEEILAISDLFLLPSEYESFGLSALEAMASGVPVLSTNAGGLSEINLHGRTGFLGDVGATEAMAEMGATLLMNNSQLDIMKSNAAQHAKQFDIHHIVPQYEQLYESLIKK